MAPDRTVSSVDHRRDKPSQFGGRNDRAGRAIGHQGLRVDCAEAQRKLGARSAARLRNLHSWYLFGGCSRRLLVWSAPAPAVAPTCGPLPGCAFTEDDPAFAQIVWRHFYVYAVSNDRSDTVAAHFPCSVADDAVLVIEGDAETPVRQDLVDRAFHRDELFFRQTVSLTYAKLSARTNSVSEP